MNYVIEGREPADALRYFEEISAIPRGSRHEKAVAQYIKAFAEARGLDVWMDEVYNVRIRKPGSKGCEHLPPVLLQGHMDIVQEKNQDTQHDFDTEGLKLQVKGDILTAKGTTLGADDGFAIAYMLAVLDRNDLVHPPLECMFTAMEEIGLMGALQLKPGVVQSKRMIGMDAGTSGQYLASSGGGRYIGVTVPITWQPAVGQGLAIHIRGLLGGHSGGMIDRERGNANSLLGRILYRVNKECPITLASLSGGFKNNAIPREADAVVLADPAHMERIQAILQEVTAELQAEFAFSDKGITVTTEPAAPVRMMDAQASAKAIALSHVLPNGFLNRSMAIEGLVALSLNVGVVTTDEEKVFYDIMIRGSDDSRMVAIGDVILDIAAGLGAKGEVIKSYPAFSYVDSSPLREMIMGMYKDATGKDGEIIAVHGGTEAGIFSRLVPGIDIVGLGPDRGEAHTPDEWMNLASFEWTFGFLVKILERLTQI